MAELFKLKFINFWKAIILRFIRLLIYRIILSVVAKMSAFKSGIYIEEAQTLRSLVVK